MVELRVEKDWDCPFYALADIVDLIEFNRIKR